MPIIDVTVVIPISLKVEISEYEYELLNNFEIESSKILFKQRPDKAILDIKNKIHEEIKHIIPCTEVSIKPVIHSATFSCLED